MRILMWGLLGFAAGAMLGYGAVVGGWVGYALYAKIGDGDGGKLMSIIFLAGPVGGLVGGLTGAFWLALRAAHRQERYIQERQIKSGLARAAE